MQLDIDRVLIPRQQLALRVAEMARQITADHTPPALAEGEELTIVPILTGAFIFCADLIRQIPLPIRIGLLTVSSYPGNSLASRGPQMLAQQLGQVTGRHLLVIDDILDSGGTMKLVVPMLRELGAASVKTCVLLRKLRPTPAVFTADYVGFEIPDEFVVGYGLDYNNYYRNLPDLVALKPEAIARHL